MTSPLDRQGFPVVPRRIAVDLLIAAVLFAGSSVWADRFWNAWIAEGGKPVFYQSYFEPAVMVACGHGFVISQVPRPAPLDDFIFERRDSFECGEIPPGLPLGTKGLYQGAWRYLLTTVGAAWWLMGISWSGLAPLFGLFFGAMVGLSYGVFRLGMGRALATIGAVFMALSTLNLLNLPHLRDYSKAPFTVALVLVVGLLITRPLRRRTVLWLAAACGGVLGLGYGFRTDSLVNIPVPVVALFGFLPGGLTRNLRLKAVAAALFLATFMAISWPITSSVYSSGGCQWHVALLGLQSPFDNVLRVRPAPYDFGHVYSDGYIDRTINGYRWRHQPDVPQLVFCSADYDAQSLAYYRSIVTTFPADMITRAYSSVLQMVELPFFQFQPPISGWWPRLYAVRARLLEPNHRWGLAAAAVAVVIAGAASLRLGLALLVFVVYFGGYPAIQFQQRHYFHLEFAGFWVVGFVLQQAFDFASRWRGSGFDWPAVSRGLIKSAAVSAAMGMLLVLLLVGARWYQVREAVALLSTYIAAPRERIAAPAAPLEGLGPDDWPQMIEVDLVAAACGDRPSVTFRYDRSDPGVDFTRTVTISHPSSAAGVTRVFQPVFQNYRGLDLSTDAPDCLAGVYRVTDVRPFEMLLGAVLPPDWESRPLYQRLVDWEGRDED